MQELGVTIRKEMALLRVTPQGMGERRETLLHICKLMVAIFELKARQLHKIPKFTI